MGCIPRIHVHTMSMDTDPKQTTPEVLSARVLDLEPLVAKWISKNPNVATSHLVRLGLKLALRPLAGKRFAHLVEGGK